jgi:anti-sigma regulatory factor (Ser/Thr protein kinase)
MGTLIQQPHRLLPVRAEEDVGAARRTVARMAGSLPGAQAGSAELAATELATNLVRHATSGGYLLCRAAGGGMELLAVDRGPGMPPGGPAPAGMAPAGVAPAGVAPAGMAPRAGGLGVGLSAVRRLSAVFDCYSRPSGTVILARLHGCPPSRNGPLAWGAVNVPLGGSGESGDGWAVVAAGRLTALVVDGLGHGPPAAQAAQAAISALGTCPNGDIERLLRRAHEAMLGTRGGVLAACAIDPGRDELTYAGVGNIAGRLLHGTRSRGLVSHDGTAGTQIALPRAKVLAYPWAPGAVVTLASDGIGRHWDAAAYPGLLHHDPAVIAATLHRDHGWGADDAMVLVIRDTRRDAA